MSIKLPRLDSLHGEESNYVVLLRVLKSLKAGTNRDYIIKYLQKFVDSKKEMSEKLEKNRILATRGSDEAAMLTMKLMTEMNDGL